jgi:perosamine synthetase
MNPSKKQFRIPQDPFLSRDFLSCRSFQQPLPHTATGNRRYFTFWARNALYHSLQVAGLSPGDEVLVPAYVCKVVPEAVASYGAKVQFYRVGRNCQPDFSDMEAKITERTRALIAVHYFGFAQPISLQVDFCKRHKLFLIEDCAHVLQSEAEGQPLGSFGDASVFSLRKFFPLYDGGELLLNQPEAKLQLDWSSESPLFTLRVANDILDQIAMHSPGSLLSLGLRLVQSLKKPWLAIAKSSANTSTLTTEKTDATFNLKVANHPMSRLSRLLYKHFNASAIVTKRRENYLFLQRELRGVEEIQFLVSELPPGICPWVFPLFLEPGVEACATLRSMGIPAVTWDGVRPLALEAELFPDAEFLYKNLVFLPVHQNLTAEDLRHIVEVVRRVLQQNRLEGQNPG